MRAAVAAVLMVDLMAADVALADEARAPTAAEQKAFEAWYRSRPATSATSAASVTSATSAAADASVAASRTAPPSGAGSATSAPKLETRRDGKRWRLTAHEDAPAVRAVLPLCRMPRTIFERQNKQWTERSETLIWVHHTAQCGPAPASAVRQRAELPELDILRLLQQQKELLQSARLLMAGNTSCAPMRSRNFQLSALERAPDTLPLLVFDNDIGGTARISVRKTGADLTAWNVNCRQ